MDLANIYSEIIEVSENSYILTSSLDVSEYKNQQIAKFTGEFDGNNHSIYGLEKPLFGKLSEESIVKNICIEQAKIQSDTQNGLVCNQNFGKIESITIANSKIAGDSNVGSICGLLRDGIIKNCQIKNTEISGEENVGSICGIFKNGNVLENTIKNVKVTGKTSIGGIIGRYNDGEGIDANTVSESKITGKSRVGGVLGLAYKYGKKHISNCSVKNSKINGAVGTGGIVGVAFDLTIQNCTVLTTELMAIGLHNRDLETDTLRKPEKIPTEKHGISGVASYIHHCSITDCTVDVDVYGNKSECSGGITTAYKSKVADCMLSIQINTKGDAAGVCYESYRSQFTKTFVELSLQTVSNNSSAAVSCDLNNSKINTIFISKGEKAECETLIETETESSVEKLFTDIDKDFQYGSQLTREEFKTVFI